MPGRRSGVGDLRPESAVPYPRVRRAPVRPGSPPNRTRRWRSTTRGYGTPLWTEVADTGPSARHGLAMAFDSARKCVVLFGGASGSNLFGDTWTWDGTEWTQVADTGPAARSGHALAYDDARERVVLFGGRTAANPLGDTWEWTVPNGLKSKMSALLRAAHTRWLFECDRGPRCSVWRRGCEWSGAE